MIATGKNEFERCSTTIYPNYNPTVNINLVGVNRPPKREHPAYAGAFREMFHQYITNNTTTLKAGDINITSWGQKYQECMEARELWELTDPDIPMI